MGPKVSVVICTLNRKESLNRCLKSLSEQTYEDFEVKIIKEKGELTKLRNQGAKNAKGEILSFIDDDVVLPKTWMEAIVGIFDKKPYVSGVSGPAIIPKAYRSNRDIFRWPLIKKAYDFIFLDGKSYLPGKITRAGTWTTGAIEETCSYEGEVDFLEACNMSWRNSIFDKVGGFDEEYRGVGDWSEPDLAFRVRSGVPGTLWFTSAARLYHLPDKTGAYLSRRTTGTRYTNYLRFSEKWVKPCLRNEMYKLFLKCYFAFKESSGWQKRLFK